MALANLAGYFAGVRNGHDDHLPRASLSLDDQIADLHHSIDEGLVDLNVINVDDGNLCGLLVEHTGFQEDTFVGDPQGSVPHAQPPQEEANQEITARHG